MKNNSHIFFFQILWHDFAPYKILSKSVNQCILLVFFLLLPFLLHLAFQVQLLVSLIMLADNKLFLGVNKVIYFASYGCTSEKQKKYSKVK